MTEYTQPEFDLFDLAQSDDCRPDEYPPYPREVHDREVTQFVAETRVSQWVRRAQANDLPTFDRHVGAFAFEATR